MTITVKIRIRPYDVESLRAEMQRSCEARHDYLRHHIRWAHLSQEQGCLTPWEAAEAARLAGEQRTGRRPATKMEVRCSQPLSERSRLQSDTQLISETPAGLERLAALRERWGLVEVVRTGMGRQPEAELQAAESRRIYALHREAGCHHSTLHLANESAAQSMARYRAANRGEIPDLMRARNRDYGRVGVPVDWISWDGYDVRLSDRGWTWVARCSADQLRQRPLTEWQRERSGRRLDRRVNLVGQHIRQAYITSEREGEPYQRADRRKWYLCLVVDTDHQGWTSAELPTDRIEGAIDLCWRRDGETTRVAYLLDSDGAHGAISMPPEIYSRIRHAESVRGLADQDVDALRHTLGLHRMTGARTVLRVADESEDPAVVALRRHAHHLYAYSRGGQVSGLRARDEHYLTQQIRPLLMRHHTLYVEKLDGSSRDSGLIRRDQGAIAGSGRQITSPLHCWLRVLQREAPKYGCQVIEVDPRMTSRTDPLTGQPMPDPGPARMVQVSDGSLWDVDHLACVEIMRRGRAARDVDVAAE